MGRLIYFGNERLANAVSESGVILQSLLDAGHEVTHLVINRAERVSRKKHEDVVVTIAHNNSINVIDTWDEQHIIDLAKECDAGVLASFGRIIKDEVIDAFPRGIINIHPSLLPLYRGTTPIESAILGGDTMTGVSVMALASKMDAGNIYASEEHELYGHESKQEIYDALSTKGAGLLIEALPSILDGSNQGVPQDDDEATFTKMITKGDGWINWNLPATVIERQIRAFAGWPGSRTELGNYELTITQAKVVDESGEPGDYRVEDNELVVTCHEGALLIEKLKPAGKSEMPTGAFLAGNQL